MCQTFEFVGVYLCSDLFSRGQYYAYYVRPELDVSIAPFILLSHWLYNEFYRLFANFDIFALPAQDK